ncbi:MAG: porin family protein [Betaproteobacteria bacterium]|nr:porin family protein [Betaproteobacteria bacterium]
MKLFRRWTILLLVAIALPVQAADPDPDYYGGLMLGVADYGETGIGYNMSTATGRLGYQMARFLAIEARGTLGGDGKMSGAGIADSTYRIKAMGSLLGKLSWQLSSDSETYLHALFGMSGALTTATAPGVSKNYKLRGGSFGIGLDLFADRNRAINFEWMQDLKGKVKGTTNKYTLTHFGVGYLQRF